MSTVEDDRVGLVLAREPLERLPTVLGQLDLVALQLQRTAQRLPHGSLVVDHQDLHVRIVRVRREKFVRSAAERAVFRDLLGVSHGALSPRWSDGNVIE